MSVDNDSDNGYDASGMGKFSSVVNKMNREIGSKHFNSQRIKSLKSFIVRVL
jgi:hypothetical protein